MTLRSVHISALVLVLTLGLPGCLFRRTPKTPHAPTPPQTKIEPPPSLPPQAKPMEEPQLPPAALPPPSQQPQVIRPRLEQTEPPKPKPQARRPRSGKTVKPAKAETAPVAHSTQPPVQPPPEQVTPPVQPPKSDIKLGEVLSEEQRRGYIQTVDESLSEARRALGSLQGRVLSREQSENESRVRTFIQQAEETRASDVRASAQFSRRAALLAKELLETLK